MCINKLRGIIGNLHGSEPVLGTVLSTVFAMRVSSFHPDKIGTAIAIRSPQGI